MKNAVRDLGISTPPQLRGSMAVMGWCGKAVDSIADRIQYNGFGNDPFNMAEIYGENNSDILFDGAILDALVGSCSFLYVSEGADGYPRIQAISGQDATGIIDPITNMLYEGYAVLERDDAGNATVEAYFDGDGTTIYQYGAEAAWYENPTRFPLLVPVINRPDVNRPFGRSQITRACMSYVQGAARTIKRSEISAEFYSFPQRYALGTDPDLVIDNKWAAAMSAMLTLSKDEDGDRPTVGQFQQQSMSPHIDQLRMFAALFAGETGLTMDDLGFVQDNPSSAEAIKSSHENLRLKARKAQRNFASGFINAGYLAASIRDRQPYMRSQIADTKIAWAPIFEPDASMMSSIGDGVNKINQVVPGYFGPNNMGQLLGIEADG